METCTHCAGEGIVGAGDFPLAKQGTLSTCTDCGGTGKAESAPTETPESEIVHEEKTEEVVMPEIIEATEEAPTEVQEEVIETPTEPEVQPESGE